MPPRVPRRSSRAWCSIISTRSSSRMGLWFPVDVSTSAQATLGGMAGNNSCGSRSIAYGNMVHNVLGARPLAVGRCGGRIRPGGAGDARRAREIAEFVRALAEQHRRRDRERWPKVLRRVGGYNLDIFHNQSERAVYRRRQRQSRAPAGRLGRHAGLHAEPHAEASRPWPAPRCWAWSISRAFMRRWRRRSTS